MRQIYYTLQTLLRGRGGNVVKLLSLSLGLLTGILLFSQIAYELSYENCYEEPEKVVILRNLWYLNGESSKNGYIDNSYRPAAADISEALPEYIESGCVTQQFYSPDIYYEGNKLEDVTMILADTLFFQTIGLKVLQGDPKELAAPDVTFISQALAQRLWSDQSPIGKRLAMANRQDVTVRGVYRTLPGNTAYCHDMVVSLKSTEQYSGMGDWNRNPIYTIFFRLKDQEDVEAVNKRLPSVVERFKTDDDKGSRVEFNVLPLGKVHLSNPDTKRRLIILGVLGFSIFFVSIMNYVLAAIASFGRRAKSVGVHKCCGANGGHVMGMFLWETAIMVITSLAIGLVLMYLFKYKMEDLLQVRFSNLFVWQNLWVAGITILLLFVIAGFLPGRMFTLIPVTQVFRRYTDSKRTWKSGLLAIQFMGIAFVLGMLLTTIWQYYDLMNRSLGFRAERLAVASIVMEDSQGAIDAIRRQPYVETLGCAAGGMLTHYNTDMLVTPSGEEIESCHFTFVTKDYPRMMGMELIEGSWPQQEGDILIGESTLKALKWTDSAVGKKLPIDCEWLLQKGIGNIVGVVKDVRNTGFFKEQTCTAFITDSKAIRSVNVRVKEPLDENLKRLNAFVQEAYPKTKIEFTTYHTIRERQNEAVYRFRNVVLITSICIVLMVMLGLIGYVSDETQRRSKEIAIRKVNGSDASGILELLSVGILKISVLAVVIGIIASWYISGIWMEQFPDCELLSPMWYMGVGVAVLVLIVVVVVVKAWHIANENPVNSIKSE